MQLFLFFTEGVSVRHWAEKELLERELALYRALQPHLGGITFVTYGDARDLGYREALGDIRVVCNRWRLPQHYYAAMLPRVLPLGRRGPALFKTHQLQGGRVALQAARTYGGKLIARCGFPYAENMERRYGSHSPQLRHARELERAVFPAAERVVVTTPAMRESLLERCLVPPQRLRVIPNYVLTDVFSPASAGRRRPRRLCFVGRLSKEKNLFALVEAVRGLDVELLVVGSGGLEGQIREKARSQNLPVCFLGNVPHLELPRILNSSEVFVLPSLYEGHPKVLIEAMACGLPVIGTDVPGIRELIRHRHTGYLCGTTAGEIRAAIREVLDDAELRARMGPNAREFAVRNFALERVASMELALLEELAP